LIISTSENRLFCSFWITLIKIRESRKIGVLQGETIELVKQTFEYCICPMPTRSDGKRSKSLPRRVAAPSLSDTGTSFRTPVFTQQSKFFSREPSQERAGRNSMTGEPKFDFAFLSGFPVKQETVFATAVHPLPVWFRRQPVQPDVSLSQLRV